MSRDEYARFRSSLRAGIHHTNEFGIQATCGDCHVPRAFIPGLMRHIAAYKEVWGHLTGKLNTPAKYEAQRPAMAQMIWDETQGERFRGVPQLPYTGRHGAQAAAGRGIRCAFVAGDERADLPSTATGAWHTPFRRELSRYPILPPVP